MNSSDGTGWMEHLTTCSDEERYRILEQAARASALRQRLYQACLILQAAGGGGRRRLSSQEMALDLARGRVARSALWDGTDLCWLLACLEEETGREERLEPVSRAARRALNSLVQPATVRRRRLRLFWLPAAGLVLASAALAAAFLLPAADPWARSLGLSRWRVGRLSYPFRADLACVVQGGEPASPPLFSSRPAPSRRERAALAAGRRPPRLLGPRWEAIPETRPVFRWEDDGEGSRESEVLLVDTQHQLVWSGRVNSSRKELAYPSAEPELEPGAAYYWKVNRLSGDRLEPSAYAGFKILAARERRSLDQDLQAAGGQPFLRAVAYLRHGVYGRAVRALRAAAAAPGGTEETRKAAARLLRRTRARQGPVD